MKTVLAVALFLMTGFAAVLLWSGGSPGDGSGSSSQIFIHDVPVCVTQRGGDIHAAVGACGEVPAEALRGLPPGHPPIGHGDHFPPGKNRGTLI